MANENVIAREFIYDGIMLREVFHLVGAYVMACSLGLA